MKKLVVITGASSGFGKALAERFSAAGYPLLLLARRLEKLEEMQLENTICRKVDVTDYDAFEAAVREAEAVYGEVDLLINNAGCMLLGNLENQDRTEWQRMLDVNVMGVMNGMQVVMEQMKKAHHGTIINVSSVAGVNPYINHAAYCASKYGVNGLSEVARQELAPHNVRVMRICPGAVKTELLTHTTSDNIKSSYNNWLETNDISITADDIAKTIQFAYEMPQTVTMREIQISDTKQAN
ncbi:NADP-dependent 3-hydroxy acid dehydrogenase YdfG [Granulicatella balaenopterae]|uniref:NADP-dependent 3-hydroxy acid dehydrogenase YdfG n=1 Tax=Granulicatella balaenopterae TaxID=137733 RepID=A0A1H9N3W7_9LACT|nr:SDR family oxidoreductase [Granulicatella balaenopterae]SER30720.1 NADP-dependent 3-hydroxy acid dehydrogenase YdfG [Granulicatella balaenopterae]